MKKWLALDLPLLYGHRDTNKTFECLVQAVVAEPQHISFGLPNLTDHSMTHTIFLNKLLSMSSPTPSAPCAPVIKNGSFLPLLIEARHSLNILSSETLEARQDSFVCSFFLRAIEHLKICYVLSHRPNTGTRGAPNRKPVFDSWAHLGARDDTSLRALPQTQLLPSSSQHSADIALHCALANDSNVEWYSKSLTIDVLCTILNKTKLPKDFHIPKPTTKGAYVDQTYDWVRSAYDGRRHTHHLALLIAIITSSFLPNLWTSSDLQKISFASANRDQVHNIYNDVDWVSKRSKGMTDRSVFISMFTTFIIALYEETSPLRLYMASASKHGLGAAWTDKHCEFYVSMFSMLLTSFLFKLLKVSPTQLSSDLA